MSLEEDLKARTLALISQQMAEWVVEIQRSIGQHQEALVRSLDELQEAVARYDEKIDETSIGQALAEVVASQPPPEPMVVSEGPGVDRLKASVEAVEKGTSLSEVLTYLVNEVAGYVDRAVMFIVKGPSAIGWYARGLDPADGVKQINIPINSDSVFRAVHNSRKSLRTQLHPSSATGQALARFGGEPQGVLAVPLVLRDKLAAVLYCDTSQEEVPEASANVVELLVKFAEKSIDVLSAAPKPGAGRIATAGSTAERAAAIKAGGDEVRERAGVPRPAPTPPPPVTSADEGSSTVMFNANSMAAIRQQMSTPTAAAAAAPARPAPSHAPAPTGVSPEEQKQHEDAKRFARLVVSEIKLYNESKVNEGRRQKDLYERLKEDIERGRQMYSDRVSPQVRDSTNYFYDELVRILAGGDANALGPM
ncbi:MAG TPA: hypothetical protein VH683_01935 [Thermoleophilaceae bacterium]